MWLVRWLGAAGLEMSAFDPKRTLGALTTRTYRTGCRELNAQQNGEVK
jgi:hypothetical protein